MPYTPFEWVDGPSGGTPITAFRLNTIEQGIAAATAEAETYTPNFQIQTLEDVLHDVANLPVPYQQNTTIISTKTITLPDGWESMDVLIIGRVVFWSDAGVWQRVYTFAEAPAGNLKHRGGVTFDAAGHNTLHVPDIDSFFIALENVTGNTTFRYLVNKVNGVTDAESLHAQQRQVYALKMRRT